MKFESLENKYTREKTNRDVKILKKRKHDEQEFRIAASEELDQYLPSHALC